MHIYMYTYICMHCLHTAQSFILYAVRGVQKPGLPMNRNIILFRGRRKNIPFSETTSG